MGRRRAWERPAARQRRCASKSFSVSPQEWQMGPRPTQRAEPGRGGGFPLGPEEPEASSSHSSPAPHGQQRALLGRRAPLPPVREQPAGPPLLSPRGRGIGDQEAQPGGTSHTRATPGPAHPPACSHLRLQTWPVYTHAQLASTTPETQGSDGVLPQPAPHGSAWGQPCSQSRCVSTSSGHCLPGGSSLGPPNAPSAAGSARLSSTALACSHRRPGDEEGN